MNSYINLNPENIWKIEVYPEETVCNDVVFVEKRQKIIKPIPFLPFLKFKINTEGGLKFFHFLGTEDYLDIERKDLFEPFDWGGGHWIICHPEDKFNERSEVPVYECRRIVIYNNSTVTFPFKDQESFQKFFDDLKKILGDDIYINTNTGARLE